MNGTGVDGYRLLTYDTGRRPVVGILVQNLVYPLGDRLAEAPVDSSSVLGLLQTWSESDTLLASLAQELEPEQGLALDDVNLLAPILYPRALFCTGANYWDHVEEMEGTIDRANRPPEPWFFMKTSAHSIVGPGTKVRGPAKSKQLDWEAELAVVIGTQARNVPAAAARDVIAAYTIMNDLSARDMMTRGDRPPSMTYDWVGQKCFDGAAPMGPWLTPASQVADCHNLSVRLWVNEVLKQDSHTSQLVHNIYEQIEWLSDHLTLLPGDVISTGTPSGVGMPRGEFLSSHDVVRIEIESCGELTNTIE